MSLLEASLKALPSCSLPESEECQNKWDSDPPCVLVSMCARVCVCMCQRMFLRIWLFFQTLWPFSVCAFQILFLNWSSGDAQGYISFRCTTLCFDESIHYAVLTTSVANVCRHLVLLRYPWLYSLGCPFHPLDFFHNWEPGSPTPPHPCCPSPHPRLTTTILFSVFSPLFLLRLFYFF